MILITIVIIVVIIIIILIIIIIIIIILRRRRTRRRRRRRIGGRHWRRSQGLLCPDVCLSLSYAFVSFVQCRFGCLAPCRRKAQQQQQQQHSTQVVVDVVAVAVSVAFVVTLSGLCPSPAWTREPLGQSPTRTLLCPTLSSFSHFRGLLCPGFVQVFFDTFVFCFEIL